jgi:hypothetical protein
MRGQQLHMNFLVRNSTFIFLNEWIYILLGLGVSLSWLGLVRVPSDFSLTPSSGIYSIDGQTPIPFLVPALSGSSSEALYNEVFFKTETLSPGQHEIIVIYQGNSGTAPLALDALIVQNATSSSSTSSFVPLSSSTNSKSSLGSKKSPPVGIIVGVVGRAIVLVLLLLLYIRRRNNRRAQKLKENSSVEPFTLLPISPRNYTPEVPSLTPQPFSSKFSRGEYANAPASGSSRPTPPPVPVIGAGINPISSAIRDIPLMPVKPSTSAQGGNLGFLRHANSGVRTGMPHAEGNLVELPPSANSGNSHSKSQSRH